LRMVKYILIGLALVIACVGLYLMIRPRQEGANSIKFWGAEFQLSTPALVLIVLGAAILLYVAREERTTDPTRAPDEENVEATVATATEQKPPPENKQAGAGVQKRSVNEPKDLEEENPIRGAYELAIGRNTRSGYLAFLSGYPAGSLADDIRERLSSCVATEKSRSIEQTLQTLQFDMTETEGTELELGTALCKIKGFDGGGAARCSADTTLKKTCNGDICISAPIYAFVGGKTIYKYSNCSASCFTEKQVRYNVENCP
jgi:hypothetical protein